MGVTMADVPGLQEPFPGRKPFPSAQDVGLPCGTDHGRIAGAAQAPATPKPFSPEELDQMLAPIALYDDALLSQVLMAASYPLEIVEAARWSPANPNLKGDAAVNAVADKTGCSVKSLVAFPSVLKQLSDHLDWTQKLGDALIGQQADVAASISGCAPRPPRPGP